MAQYEVIMQRTVLETMTITVEEPSAAAATRHAQAEAHHHDWTRGPAGAARVVACERGGRMTPLDWAVLAGAVGWVWLLVALRHMD